MLQKIDILRKVYDFLENGGRFKFSGATVVNAETVDPDRDIVIMIMGKVGVGKTSFVSAIMETDQWLTENGFNNESELKTPAFPTLSLKDNNITHDLVFGTSYGPAEAVGYRFPVQDTDASIFLVDVPGLDDARTTSEFHVLDAMLPWLFKTSDEKSEKLTVIDGILILHGVDDIRFQKGLSILFNIFGDYFRRAALGTTMWNNIQAHGDHDVRERENIIKAQYKQLELEVYSKFDATDSTTAKATAHETIQTLLKHLVRNFSHLPQMMRLQEEVVNKKKQIHNTSAGRAAFMIDIQFQTLEDQGLIPSRDKPSQYKNKISVAIGNSEFVDNRSLPA